MALRLGILVMSNINLLPWREDLRQVKNKNFLAVLTITVVASGFLVLCADLVLDYKIKVLAIKHNNRNIVMN